MNQKKCWLSVIAVVGVLFVTDFVIHGILLKGAYEATASLWRPMEVMHSMMWTMWVIYIVNGMVLPYIYSKGFEAGKSPVGQGLRFGLVIGLLMATGMSLGTYFMIAIPVSLAVSWFVGGMVQYALVGLALGAIYKPTPA